MMKVVNFFKKKKNLINIKLFVILLIIVSWIIHIYEFNEVKIHLIEIERNVNDVHNLLLIEKQQQQQQQLRQTTNLLAVPSPPPPPPTNESTTTTTLLTTTTHQDYYTSSARRTPTSKEFTTTTAKKVIKGEWGDYLVVDPTRVRRTIINKRYFNNNESTTTTGGGLSSLSLSSSSSSLLNSYLPFRSIEEKKQVCNMSSHPKSPTIDFIYNRIQVNSPNQGFYYQMTRRTRSSSVNTTLQNHLLLLPNVTEDGRQEYFDDETNTTTTNPKGQSPKILCILYTYHERNHMISAVVETWGWKCDGFIAASTRNIYGSDGDIDIDIDDSSRVLLPLGYGSIKLPHKGKESYGNMWQKTRSIMQYLYNHYYLDDEYYDFFYVCGDDVHVIVENMKSTLNSLPYNQAYNQPLFMGQWIPLIRDQSIMKSKRINLLKKKDDGDGEDDDDDDYFVGGGPGYVLNRLTLKLLVEELLPNCHVGVKSSTEDILISDCLKRHGIKGNNTVDKFGRQRFDECPKIQNQITIGLENQNLPEFWMNVLKFWSSKHYYFTTTNNTANLTVTDSNNNMDDIDIVKQYHNPYNRISRQIIAMHGFKTPIELKKHHARLYNSC